MYVDVMSCFCSCRLCSTNVSTPNPLTVHVFQDVIVLYSGPRWYLEVLCFGSIRIPVVACLVFAVDRCCWYSVFMFSGFTSRPVMGK